MTYEESALLSAIAADPADDLARLVFADWLEEFKEDGTERAEAIRRGVANPKWFQFPEGEGAILGFTPSRPDLPDPCRVTLARGYPGVCWQTYKGLIGACVCTWETWLDNGGTNYALGDRLLVKNWIPEVVLTTPPVFVSRGNPEGIQIEGRDRRYLVREGFDSAQAVLGAEWPAVRRWIVPEMILGVRWMFPNPDEDDEIEMPTPSVVDRGSCPQVGAAVKVFTGRVGTLIAPVDADGRGCVRSEYK